MVRDLRTRNNGLGVLTQKVRMMTGGGRRECEKNNEDNDGGLIEIGSR